MVSSEKAKFWLLRGLFVIVFSFLLSYFISSEMEMRFPIILGAVLSTVSVLVAIYSKGNTDNAPEENTQSASEGDAIHVHGDNNTIVTHPDALSDEQIRESLESEIEDSTERED